MCLSFSLVLLTAFIYIDDLSGNAYQQIYGTEYITLPDRSPLYKVILDLQPTCSNSDCDTQTPVLTIDWYNAISLVDLSIIADINNYQTVVDASTIPLENLAQVFYNGIRLDLGHYTPNNVCRRRYALDKCLAH